MIKLHFPRILNLTQSLMTKFCVSYSQLKIGSTSLVWKANTTIIFAAIMPLLAADCKKMYLNVVNTIILILIARDGGRILYSKG